jgi:HEAT repeat protein
MTIKSSLIFRFLKITAVLLSLLLVYCAYAFFAGFWIVNYSPTGRILPDLRRARVPVIQLSGILITFPDKRLRMKAAWTLGETRDARAVRPLISALYDLQLMVRDVARQALVKIGKPSVRPLLESLGVWNGIADNGFLVAEILGDIKDTACVPGLIDIVQSGSHITRPYAARALGLMGDHRAVDVLTAALSSKVPALARESAEALGRLDDRRAAGPLCSALRSDDPEVRMAAAGALGHAGDSASVGPLLDALDDPVMDVVRNAATALGKVGDPRSAGPLFRMMDPKDPRWQACSRQIEDALRALGPRAIDTVLAMLEKGNDERKRLAIGICADSKDPRIDVALVKFLRSASYTLRKSAVAALAQHGGSSAISALIALLKDPDPYVRTDAVKALARIDDGRIEAPLLAILTARPADASVESIGPWLAAAGALQERKCARAKAPLRKALQSGYPEPVRCQAAWSLGGLRDTLAVPALMAMLSDSTVSGRNLTLVQSDARTSAAYALGRIGDERAIAPLKALVSARDRKLAATAREALAAIEGGGK